MFVRQNQQQFRTAGADVQIFYGSAGASSRLSNTWNKPPGVSHVYMLLIGPGANGTGTIGGGSGATTVWYGAAQNVPDVLELSIGQGGSGSTSDVNFRTTSGTPFLLLRAFGASSNAGASASTANTFAASGFFRSVAGQSGSSTSISAATTTFLAGGADSGNQDSNYGYSTPTKGGNRDGYLLLQPIIVGMGGALTGKGGIGCGGGSTSGFGGAGMILIASW
jgi:hypothetical protein